MKNDPIFIVVAEYCGQPTPWAWGDSMASALAGGEQQCGADMAWATEDDVVEIPGAYRVTVLELLHNKTHDITMADIDAVTA